MFGDQSISPDAGDVAARVGADIVRMQASIAAAEQALADHLGIHRTALRALEALVAEGPMTAGRLARTVGLTPGALTPLLDRMERAGYVSRVRDGENRRQVRVELRARTRGAVERLLAPRRRLGREHLDHLAPDQLRLLHDVLHGVIEESDRYATWVRSLPPEPGRAGGL